MPENNRFLVCDHDEVWEVAVGSSAQVRSTNYAPYDVAARSEFVGWGREDATPVLTIGERTITYDFDPRATAVSVLLSYAGKEEQIDFPTLSGDWFGASCRAKGACWC